MKFTEQRAVSVLASLLLIVGVAACGSDDDAAEDTTTTTAAFTDNGGEGDDDGEMAAVPTAEEVCASPPEADPLDETASITIAMPVKVQNFNHSLVAEALGELEAENIDASIEILQTPDIVTLLAQGNVDVGAIGLNAGVLNAIAAGVDLKWVGGFTRVLPTDQAGLYVRDDWVEDAETFDAADLRGSTIAVGVGGLATQQILDVKLVLDEAGVGLDEVEIVELASSDFGAALQSRAVDAVSASNVQQILDQGTGVKVAGIAPITAGGYFFNQSLLDGDREVGLAIMRALIRTQCEHLQGNYYEDTAVLDALVGILEIPEDSVVSQPPLTFELKIADGSLEQLEAAWREQDDLLQYEGEVDRDDVIDESIYVEAAG